MQYIDCQKYAQEILDEVKAIPDKKELYILTMGNNPASQSYVKGKIKDCDYCGIPYSHIQVNTTDSLERHIHRGNTSNSVGGVIVQLPLPEGVDEELYTECVSHFKDVDGFRAKSKFDPCTPEGIMYVLHKELGDLTGKTALVIGKGKLVGKPIADMLLNEGVTVTVAHSKTEYLDRLIELGHDIIISAVGKPNLVNLEWCNAEIVIDAGISRDENGKLVGDCRGFNEVTRGSMKVTPVPGGIGLMTRAMLMKHMGEV